jgi:hypothetical protein
MVGSHGVRQSFVAMKTDPVRDIIYFALKVSRRRRVLMAIPAVFLLIDVRRGIDELPPVVTPPAQVGASVAGAVPAHDHFVFTGSARVVVARVAIDSAMGVQQRS